MGGFDLLRTRWRTAMRWIAHLPQGSSLRFGLCCPDPSTLSRPHASRSQAHRDFTARRLIRDAFAVRATSREDAGNRNVPASCRSSPRLASELIAALNWLTSFAPGGAGGDAVVK